LLYQQLSDLSAVIALLVRVIGHQNQERYIHDDERETERLVFERRHEAADGFACYFFNTHGGHLSLTDHLYCLGLIVIELVMNTLKHAYPHEKTKGQITVTYDMAGTNWKLSVSDDGIGKPDGVFAQAKAGLGTGIVKALSDLLRAQVETLAGPGGTIVSITHATFPAKAAT
jgi:signal transduction histidine kinase